MQRWVLDVVLPIAYIFLVDIVMDDFNGIDANVDVSKPVFIVVEAKRTSKVADASSAAELMGQLTSQLLRRYTSLHFFLSDSSFILKSPHFYILINSQRFIDASWRPH